MTALSVYGTVIRHISETLLGKWIAEAQKSLDLTAQKFC